MRRRLFVNKFLKVIAFLGISSSFIGKRTISLEGDLRQSFIQYRDNTNDDTANQLYKALPLYDSYNKKGRKEIDKLYNQSFDVLENHLATGSRGAIDLAFRLFLDYIWWRTVSPDRGNWFIYSHKPRRLLGVLGETLYFSFQRKGFGKFGS